MTHEGKTHKPSNHLHVLTTGLLLLLVAPIIRYQYYFLRTPARISHYPVSCDDTNAALATFLQDTAAMYRPCFDNNPTASRRLGLAYLTSYLLSSSPSPSALPKSRQVENPAARWFCLGTSHTLRGRTPVHG